MQDRTQQSAGKVAPTGADGAQRPTGDTPAGFAMALGAYLLWGVMPLYFSAAAHIPLIEFVAHRVIWAVPIAGILLVLLGRLADLRAAFGSPRMLLMAAVTATIISVNWGIYIWAINSGRAVEAALGYYINPLVSVLLGAVLLGERLNRYQLLAVALATVAVLVLTVQSGGLPWVSIALAGSFAAYGYLRKTLPIGPSQGFFLEVLILSAPALAYVGWLEMAGQGHLFSGTAGDVGLLLIAGPATAIPLILYGFAAKALRISSIGLMQYTTPTMVAIIAVFVFGEPFGMDRVIAFGLIWTALAIYTWSIFFARTPPPPVEPPVRGGR